MTHWKLDILVAMLLVFIVTRTLFPSMSRRRILLIYLRKASLIAHQNLRAKDYVMRIRARSLNSTECKLDSEYDAETPAQYRVGEKEGRVTAVLNS